MPRRRLATLAENSGIQALVESAPKGLQARCDQDGGVTTRFCCKPTPAQAIPPLDVSVSQPPMVPIGISTRRRPTSTIHDPGRGTAAGSYSRPNPPSWRPGRTPSRARHSKPQIPAPVRQGTSRVVQPDGAETRNAARRRRPEKSTMTRVARHSGLTDRFSRVYRTLLTRDNVPPISNHASHPVGEDVPAISGETSGWTGAHRAIATTKRSGQQNNHALVSITIRESANARLQPWRLKIAPVAVGCKPMLGARQNSA